MADPLLAHAAEFTAIEDLTLDVWLEAENEGFDEHAKDILHAGLMAEHFNSVLPHDRSKRTVDQVRKNAELQTELQVAITEFRLAQATKNLSHNDSGD